MSQKKTSLIKIDTTPARTLLHLMSGYRVTQVIYVAAQLRIADKLKDGPKSVGELANSVGANPRVLHHVLQALANIGVFAEADDGKYEITPLGEPLQTGSPDSVWPTAILWAEEMHWRPWGELLHSVKTGEPAFQHIFDMGPYDYLNQNAGADEIFHQAMAGGADHHGIEIVVAYDFSGISKFVDLGGGQGTLVATILDAYPKLQGIVFDRPSATERAWDQLKAKGVSDRCQVIGGSLFEAIPPGADAYILSRTIHVFDDDSAVLILKNIRQAMGKDAEVLVIDGVMRTAKQPSSNTLADVNLLLMGGIERTEDEFNAILFTAGFQMTSVTPMESGLSIMVGKPI